jgi:hypothetical protein
MSAIWITFSSRVSNLYILYSTLALRYELWKCPEYTEVPPQIVNLNL